MIKDLKIIQAISSISQRAERQRDIDKIINSYVDVGILPQLMNNNNQILFGRRGTGKTHILKYFQNVHKDDNHRTICFIDCRILGSSPQFSDASLSLSHRCSSLFIDILNEICNSLLNHIAYKPNSESDLALNSLDDFSNSSIGEIQKGKKIVEKSSSEHNEDRINKFSLNTQELSYGIERTKGKSSRNEKTSAFDKGEYEKIMFPDLNHHLNKVLKYASTELILIIDEWSALPLDIQPYLAEFFKKSFIASPKITLKIGALEYRSNFTIPREKHNYIGFELGSDISSNLDIDEYYVYDRNPFEITKVFTEILYKHISSELSDDYLKSKYGIKTSNQFIQAVFSGKPAFNELVRASEGVIRDFINIFNIAFFDAQRKGQKNIDKKTIIESGRQWFENDKSKNLDEQLHNKIRRIIDEVIGNKKARSFMVSRELERHPIIQKLFDARVIHLVKKGYSDKDNPGIRYSIYSLDYGTYVDLINTSKQPQIDFIKNPELDTSTIVPFDDNRSIRRIILTQDILD
ncbi:hypothetical protein JCM19298_2007 [Nonlabens ulvanivorans]|nr:hypothetical protein [Nonlabens ulvanivorans]GAK93288.1 hypothetical protein JCM19298_2007 [Nonlabens ulvanivorans]